MKLATAKTVYLIAGLSILAVCGAAQAEDTKKLYYQMTKDVGVAITGAYCTVEKIKHTHPWIAMQYHIPTGTIEYGCFGPQDMNNISFIWENAKPYTLPANAFLLPQGLNEPEVKKIPEIVDDGTRQHI